MAEQNAQVVLAEEAVKGLEKALPGVKKGKLDARLISDRKLPFTHTKAYEHLSLERFDQERQIRQNHVQYLYDEVNAGRFLWDLVILATAKMKNKKYQINGQHTCTMRLNLPDSPPPQIRYLEYEVSNEDQLRRLYSVFDRGLPRGPAHILKVQLMGNEMFSQIWPSIVPAMGSGFRIWQYETKEEQRRRRPDDIARMMSDEYTGLVLRVAEFLQRFWSTQRHIHKASVIAAMYATFDQRPTLATEFWTPIADGLGLTVANDPRYKLRDFLQKAIISKDNAPGGKGGYMKRKGGSIRITGTEEVYRICVHAWNKWRDGEKLDGALRGTNRRVMAK